jgi:predicted lipoprotein with Yx(FWY)xxD motif
VNSRPIRAAAKGKAMSTAIRVISATLLALATSAAGAQTASPAPTPAPAATPAPAPVGPPIRKLNGHLVDAKGRGLYIWDGDTKGSTSECSSQCRLLWPPLYADDNAVPKPPFDLVKRDDGRYQWALNGRPLYRWASDKKWGDAGGDTVAGVWHLVKVAPPKKAAE